MCELTFHKKRKYVLFVNFKADVVFRKWLPFADYTPGELKPSTWASPTWYKPVKTLVLGIGEAVALVLTGDGMLGSAAETAGLWPRLEALFPALEELVVVVYTTPGVEDEWTLERLDVHEFKEQEEGDSKLYMEILMDSLKQMKKRGEFLSLNLSFLKDTLGEERVTAVEESDYF